MCGGKVPCVSSLRDKNEYGVRYRQRKCGTYVCRRSARRKKEDLSGIPFVGAAGKLLDKYLCAVGIDRENVYIANILKCRPPHNRDPKPEEEDECIGFLREQVRLIQPRVIVCLGRISAMRLIKPDFRITKEHGIFYKKGKYTICAVFHPAALLRDPRKREDMLTDMKNIKALLDGRTGTEETAQ